MTIKKRDTPGERTVSRLHDQLPELIKRSGRKVWQVGALFDYDRCWVRDRRRSRRMEVGQLLDVLAFLGRNPWRFLRELLPDEPPILDPPMGEEPEVLAAVRQRLEHGRKRRGRPHGKRFLEDLDGLRYEDPEKVVARAVKAVATIDRERLPGLLGVLGSAWRLRGELDWAEHVIYFGWRLAVESRDRGTAAQLLQRMAYVLAAQGDLVEALWVAERAQLQFNDLGDLAGIGKVLVDKGIFLNNLGRRQRALESYDAALLYLPKKEVRNRASAVTNKARCYRDSGRLEEAHEAACLALEYVSKVEPSLRAKIFWVAASILMELGEDRRVVELLSRVIEELRPVNPYDCALATIDLIRFHMFRRRPREAFEVAQSMPKLFEPLQDNSVACAAITDLLRGGLRSMTLALLDSVEEQFLRAVSETKRETLGGKERPRWAFLRKRLHGSPPVRIQLGAKGDLRT